MWAPSKLQSDRSLELNLPWSALTQTARLFDCFDSDHTVTASPAGRSEAFRRTLGGVKVPETTVLMYERCPHSFAFSLNFRAFKLLFMAHPRAFPADSGRDALGARIILALHCRILKGFSARFMISRASLGPYVPEVRRHVLSKRVLRITIEKCRFAVTLRQLESFPPIPQTPLVHHPFLGSQ